MKICTGCLLLVCMFFMGTSYTQSMDTSIRALSQEEMDVLAGGACQNCSDFSWRIKNDDLCDTYDKEFNAFCHPVGGEDCNDGDISWCGGCVKVEFYEDGSPGGGASIHTFCYAGTLFDSKCLGGNLFYVSTGTYECK